MQNLFDRLIAVLTGKIPAPPISVPPSASQPIPEPVKPPIILSNREKLIKASEDFFGIDPTPNDAQPDEYACAESLTIIIRKVLPDFPILTYTPILLKQLQNDSRFKTALEMKEGNIIISPTNTGNGNIIGHAGLMGKNGKILSNSSTTGLWTDKYDTISWIDRYSRKGQLALYLFEIV